MKMDYIVSQDGSPYIYVTLSNPNDLKAGVYRGPQFKPFGANAMAFTSKVMNNSPKATSNMGKATGEGFPTDSPTFIISMREYEDM